MLKKVAVLAMVLFSVNSGVSFADESIVGEEIGGVVEVGTQNSPMDSATAPSGNQENDEWEFLDCVRSRHDCRHEAQDHGYHHYAITRDHHVCRDHHRPYACYGIDY